MPEELRVKDLCVDRSGREVLVDLSFSVNAGGSLAIVGPSGVGKTTLLDTLCGLAHPKSGSVLFDGFDVSASSVARTAAWRLRKVGIVYQFAELLPELTLAENTQLPLLLAGQNLAATIDPTRSALESLGIGHLADSFPSAVSGGERQRAAIARAVVHRPNLILADEPTGALDRQTAEVAAQLLLKAAADVEAVLIIATHNPAVADLTDAVLDLQLSTTPRAA